jgi:hypothetical protein
LKPHTIGIQTFPSQFIKREMLQYCAIKQYRQREREVTANRPDITIKNKKIWKLIETEMLCNRKRKRS